MEKGQNQPQRSGPQPSNTSGGMLIPDCEDRETYQAASGAIAGSSFRHRQMERHPSRVGTTCQESGSEGTRIIDVNLDDPRLLTFLAAQPGATVYHHPAWLRTLCAEYDRKILILACAEQDGGLLGIFPLMYTRGLPLPLVGGLAETRIASLPRTPIAGPLGQNENVLRLLLKAAMERVSGQAGVRLQIRTEGPVLDGLVDGVSGTSWRQSFVLPLPEDPTQLKIGSSATQRSRIRWSVKKARSLGLRVRMASPGESLDEWYGLYLQTMRRIVVPPRSLRFFRAMQEQLEPLGLLKIMVAERDTAGNPELIAGSLFLMYGDRVFYAFTGCPAKYFSLRPHDLIQWEAIQWAAQHGYREYDLGEVSEGDAELASFKAKWGAQERTLYRYYHPQIEAAAVHSSAISSHQSGFKAALWRRMSPRVTARVGNLLYSYF